MLEVTLLKVFVNGKEEHLEEGVTLAGFVASKTLSPETIIVEYNYCVVKKEEWIGIVLKENDRLEILRFVGGG